MKTIELTQGFVTLVDDCDYAYLVLLGVWFYHKDKKGGYARHASYSGGKQKVIHMHRVVAERAGMKIVGLEVDHIDTKDPLNGLNNQRNNLRPATSSDQCANRSVFDNNTSGYKGVFRDRNRWRVQIGVNGKRINLGRFDNKEDAARTYNAAAIKHFGEFAFLNEVPV